jgi:hypothetical protein
MYRCVDPTNPAQLRFDWLTSTYLQPFWTEDKGWTRARMLEGTYSGPSRLRLVDGLLLEVEGRVEIYRTDRAAVGWVAAQGRHGNGWLYDYEAGEYVGPDEVAYDDRWASSDDDFQAPFATSVHALQVEDWNTCFVGEHGVWVGMQAPPD